MIYVGTAGWSIPRAASPRFASEGSHLERYARVLPSAEINSSFYRPHQPATYAKWAASTPKTFRFAVKVPKFITHEMRFKKSRAAFERFLDETRGLGARRGPILVQLPPSFAFEPRGATSFFKMVRELTESPVVCEPRHPTWFTAKAEALLIRFEVARVAADPPTAQGSDIPGGWKGLAYFRLHGSPRMYWSRYEADYISRLAAQVLELARGGDVWCIFDNTATGSAIENALELQALVNSGSEPAACSVRDIHAGA